MKHFLPRDLKCHVFPAVTFWWQNAAALWKEFLLFTLSLCRTSVARCASRGLSCLWRITFLHSTGNSFEELKKNVFLSVTRAVVQLQSARCSGFVLLDTALTKARLSLGVKVSMPGRNGGDPSLSRRWQTLSQVWTFLQLGIKICANAWKGVRNLALCEWLMEKGCFHSEFIKTGWMFPHSSPESFLHSKQYYVLT